MAEILVPRGSQRLVWLAPGRHRNATHLHARLDLGNFLQGGAGNSFTVPVVVPNNPLLSGFQFYSTNITYYALNVQGFSFSPAYTVTIN